MSFPSERYSCRFMHLFIPLIARPNEKALAKERNGKVRQFRPSGNILAENINLHQYNQLPTSPATFEEVKPKAMQMFFSFQVAFVCFSYSCGTMNRKLRGNTQIKDSISAQL